MFDFGEPDRDRRELAEVLRELRKAAGLSGDRLAVKAHMSQAKISRIETGRVLPTVTEVDRILTALAVPADQAAELLKLTRTTNIDFVSRRQVRRVGIQHRQRELTGLIEQAAEVRYFLAAGIPSFLQTPEYARANIASPLNKVAPDQREALVEAKLERGELLKRGQARFEILFVESAIRFPVLDGPGMARQAEHLRRMSLLPNVQLAVIPQDTRIDVPALNIFVVYDRRLVTMETFAGVIAFRDPAHVTEHLEVFDYFRRHALSGDAMRELLARVAGELTGDR
ncbi:helix-turn-helix domain-containing protein [Amycolatopsis sp. NPDC059021]|uniref:helix-turn-helix domain-containing protein n=1 Tax=Amycolatopsis sp. NPDC059021 TaxID=3346704 RepID=UPI00366FAED0